MKSYNPHIIIPSNKDGRDYAIGDLHGSWAVFKQCLKDVDFDKTKDRLFSVGDIIDRGEDSFRCLKLIDEPWFYAVQGNHEEMMYRGISGDIDYYQCWVRNGGDWCGLFEDEELIPWCEKLKALPLTISIETNNGLVGLSHAAPPSSFDWNDRFHETKEFFLWDRGIILDGPHDKMVDNVYITIHGHTPRHKVVHYSNSYWIDTGACWKDGKLTMVQIQPVFDLRI